MMQRSNKFSTRRQEDIKDQNAEYSINATQSFDFKKSFDPAHQRRMFDRESRR